MVSLKYLRLCLCSRNVVGVSDDWLVNNIFDKNNEKVFGFCLLYWCIYIVYFLCFVVIMILLVFILFYSMVWGKEIFN